MPYGRRYFSNLYDLVVCLMRAVDLISEEVANHHQRVAFIVYRLAERLELSVEEKRDAVLAALLHDVGALSFHDRLDFLDELPDTIHRHGFLGAMLLEDFSQLQTAAEIVKYHHVYWENGKGAFFEGNAVPMLSHLVHLADRIAVKIVRHENVISQIERIREVIRAESGSGFVPEYIQAFLSICDKEAFWLDLFNMNQNTNLPADLGLEAIQLTLDEVVELTGVFSRIIDFRSPFTAMHSAGVAETAVKLATLCGFSEDECKKMRVAGNLHDIGKLAVPRSILEKQAKLEPEEFDVIRSHSYYSYRLLEPVTGFRAIAEWGAFHHEKLNGRGYPFHLVAAELSLGSRIMAVADVFTAITEDRPYRIGMSRERTETVLRQMAENSGISTGICTLLLNNFEEISQLRRAAAENAKNYYANLFPEGKSGESGS